MFGDKRRPPATIAAEIDRIIGLNIQKAREEVRLGQHEMAALLGISTHVLARYEDGQERTPAAVLLELTRHLGCQLTDLFAGMPSLEVEEDFQGSRPSSMPIGEPREAPLAKSSKSSQPTDLAVETAVIQPAVVNPVAPLESAVATGRPDAAAVARIIEAYSALRSPLVRERLLQLLQALQ